VITEMASTAKDTLAAFGDRAREVANTEFSKRALVAEFCDVLDHE
jgi:hypothetical protein